MLKLVLEYFGEKMHSNNVQSNQENQSYVLRNFIWRPKTLPTEAY